MLLLILYFTQLTKTAGPTRFKKLLTICGATESRCDGVFTGEVLVELATAGQSDDGDVICGTQKIYVFFFNFSLICTKHLISERRPNKNDEI